MKFITEKIKVKDLQEGDLFTWENDNKVRLVADVTRCNELFWDKSVYRLTLDTGCLPNTGGNRRGDACHFQSNCTSSPRNGMLFSLNNGDSMRCPHCHFPKCTDCWDKGYSTVRIGTQSELHSELHTEIIPCKCDRGKQIKGILKVSKPKKKKQ